MDLYASTSSCFSHLTVETSLTPLVNLWLIFFLFISALISVNCFPLTLKLVRFDCQNKMLVCRIMVRCWTYFFLLRSMENITNNFLKVLYRPCLATSSKDVDAATCPTSVNHVLQIANVLKHCKCTMNWVRNRRIMNSSLVKSTSYRFWVQVSKPQTALTNWVRLLLDSSVAARSDLLTKLQLFGIGETNQVDLRSVNFRKTMFEVFLVISTIHQQDQC